MSTKKGHAQELMISFFKKEASYDAGVTMNDTNACSIKGFEGEPDWPDVVASDQDGISGSEHATEQEIIEKRFKMPLSIKNAKPNDLIGLAAMALGSVSSAQDGAEVAYKHVITPVAVGTALPSVQLEHKKGGIQYYYSGVKCNSLEISGDAGGMVSVAAELMGSGTRAASATAFSAKITESWLKMNQMSVWKESEGNISIDATLTQGAENISSGTPTALKARMRNFSLKINNNLEELPGFGGGGVLQDLDYVRRMIELALTLEFNDATELGHFTAQDSLALEFDLKGAQITGASTMYFGFQFVIPLLQLKKAPLPQGGAGDTLTLPLECLVMDDGTNPVIKLVGYNAKSAYLA